jgi:hypothetical protein
MIPVELSAGLSEVAMSMLDEINGVVESLFKAGTRYRTEKFILIGVYMVVVGVSVAWGISGIGARGGLVGEFETYSIAEIDEQKFVLKNVGEMDWKNVTVGINGRYLHHFEALNSAKSTELNPEQFKYYFYVPRPLGYTGWERLASTDRPDSTAPSGVEIDDIAVRTEGGKVRVERGVSDP